MLVTTIATWNEFAEALLMAESVKEHHPKASVIVCLIENSLPESERYPWVKHFVLARDLGIPDFDAYMSRFQGFQHVSVLRGYLFRFLADVYSGENEFIYLDARMLVVSPLKEFRSMMSSSTIVLTPHFVEPFSRTDCSREIQVLTDGTFHMGMIGMTRTQELGRLLNWWIRAIREFDGQHVFGGSLHDQKCLNLVPGYFQTGILRHPGYNVGFWNIHEQSRFIYLNRKRYTAGSERLRCFNFNNDNSSLTNMMGALFPHEASIHQLWAKYSNALQQMKSG
ncbi:hypothetical protein MUG84_04240 [Paenibacillus sp. KQZ6P-2]|uniref:Glycosyl transferase n=1 Tax=Paenibacillus mangrovi TaxID=2931978 RepID=A0A9X1WSK3_9BACL|nr:hypothetical protein [Paenibacillus mangrovi]MCJ8010954.1 hypothetical protein [Paenibacillus mangrovi]